MGTWLKMITGRTRKQYPAAQVIPYAGFILLFCLFLWRAYRGFDWSDESAYYAAPYRLVLGDLPLVDSWDSHTGWSLLAAPFLWIYRALYGNMDGVLLAGRLVFVFAQILAGLLVYHHLLEFCRSHLAAMVSGWLVAAFVPGMVINFSYESVGLFAMLLAAVLLLWEYRREAAHVGRTSFFVGCLAGLSILVYPSFLPGMVPMAVLLALFRPARQKKGWRSLYPLFLFLVGSLLLPLAAILFLGNLLGWKTLCSYFPWLITSRDCPFSSYGKEFFTFFQGYAKADVLYLVEISMLALLLLSKWVPLPFDLPFKIQDIFHMAVKIILPVCFLANVVWTITQPTWDVPVNTKMGWLLASAGLWPVILCILNPSRRSRLLLLGLYLPGQLMALGAHLSDGPELFGASFAMLPSMLAAVLIVYENYGPLLRSVKAGTMEIPIAVLRVGMAMLAFFLLGTTLFIRGGLAYRDLPVSELTVQMETGPAKGIYTNEVDAVAYEEMVAEIRQSQQGKEKVLIIGNLPFGYLCSEKRPVSPFVSEVSLKSSQLYDYLVEDLGRRPEWIYVPKQVYGYGNEKNTVSQKQIQWIASGTVSSEESAYSFIYIAQDDRVNPNSINNLESN